MSRVPALAPATAFARSGPQALLEPLEGRRQFSATVTETFTGFYEVHGNPGNNSIDITVSMVSESLTLSCPV